MDGWLKSCCSSVFDEKTLRNHSSSDLGSWVDLQVSGSQLILLEFRNRKMNSLNSPIDPLPLAPDPGPGLDLLHPGSGNLQLFPVPQSQLILPSFQHGFAGLPGLEGHKGKVTVNLGELYGTKVAKEHEDIFAGHAVRNI